MQSAGSWGNTTGVEYVDPSQVSVTGYYNVLVNEFVAAGYRRGVDIRGAPYDFRKSPSMFVQLVYASRIDLVTVTTQPSSTTTTNDSRLSLRRRTG